MIIVFGLSHQVDALSNKTPIIDRKPGIRTIEFMANVGNNIIIFKIKGKPEVMPSCASTHRYATPAKGDLAKKVKIAFKENWEVSTVIGTGQCDIWTNAEDLKSIVFDKPQ
ncbi:MAG: hypothetical protein AAGB12_13435 [Pseudomonadota bacterium]